MAKDPAENFESVVDYTTVLENFEGPLDLLLFLIKQEKNRDQGHLRVQVTEQFLEYMKGLPYIDIDKASEYLAIASTILEIKARSLVPALVEPETEEEDPESTLIRALGRVQNAQRGERQAQRAGDHWVLLQRAGQKRGRGKDRLQGFQPRGLLKAFTDLMLRQEARMRSEGVQRESPKDVYTFPTARLTSARR